MKKRLLFLVMLILSIFLGATSSKDAFVSAEDNNNCIVTFDFNVGSIEKFLPDEMTGNIHNYSQNYNIGDYISKPTISSSFDKYYDYFWTVNGVKVDLETYRVQESIRLIMEWQPVEYTIYYMYSDNEKNEISNIKFQETYSVEKCVRYFRPERSNYIFLDWYSSSEFLYNDIQIYTDNRTLGDKVLYPKWAPVEYRINYHTDAENELNPRSYNVESETFVLQAPHKVGHIFKGWFYDSNFTLPARAISKGDYGNLNLYPLWELEKYNVTYIMPDGTTQVVQTEYGKNADKPTYKTSIFNVLKYSCSNKNITDDQTIEVSVVSIVWVYVLGLILIGGIITIVILVKRNREKNLHKLKQIYQSNLNHKKRKIR